jgi:hypothetical protein
MSKTKIILSLLLVLGLGALSLYLNRDWFAANTIQISHRVSPWLENKRPGARGGKLGPPVAFTLSGYYRLTSVNVVLAEDIATNKYAHPIWSLVTESNSVPTASFVYGGFIRDMHPPVKGVRADPLEPGITYRLLITTKDQAAQHDFSLGPKN